MVQHRADCFSIARYHGALIRGTNIASKKSG
jgi:hypothetical protein